MADAPRTDPRDVLSALETKLRRLESELRTGTPGAHARDEAASDDRGPTASPPPRAPSGAASGDSGGPATPTDAADATTPPPAAGTADATTPPPATATADATTADATTPLPAAATTPPPGAPTAGDAIGAAPEGPTEVVVEAAPVDDLAALEAFRRAVAAAPGARDVYLRSYDAGRAVLEVRLGGPDGA